MTLPKYTLEFSEKRGVWTLKHDKTHKLVKSFSMKEKALNGGVLKRAVGKLGGSVKVQKKNGRYQEERTFPKSADPRGSKG
ncbi:MAG: DUF2188 domain-containing protein [Minisyncoccia bacterium]